MEKIKRIWTTVIVAVLVYLLMGLYANIEDLMRLIRKIEIEFFIKLLLLTSIGYIVRFLKWCYLVENAGVRINFRENAFVFFSGLSMTITPAKIGEIWRSFLIKEIKEEKLSKTIPIVVFDRITDVFSLLFLSLFGFFYYREGLAFILLILMILVFLIFVLGSRRTTIIINYVLEKRFKKYVEDFAEFHQRFSELNKLKIILFSTFTGVIAWFFECIAMHITILKFGGNFDITLSTFIFSFASLAGAVSMIPGGLGVAEFTISGLLQYFGMRSVEAVGTSMLIRIATLWYGASLGLAIYFSFKKFFK